MREVDIVYLYEHTARELDAACAITAILEREYHLSVEIVQWPVGFPSFVAKLRPRLVILPYCYFDESYRMLLAFWRESIFVNLSWEQLFYLGNEKAKTPRGDFPLKHVLHQAWSQQFAGFLKQAGVPEEHIFTNGHLAYSLYDEPYCRYFASRAELTDQYHLDISSKWILFPENYNWAFYPESMIKLFLENGQSASDIQVMRDYCIQSLTEVLLWCAQAAQNDEVEIILRPRPSTPMPAFLAFVNRVLPVIPPRLHIIQRGSIREWILASDKVISSHSTSLIEAAIAGKSAAVVAPFPIPAQIYVDWYDMLPHISTHQEFISFLNSDHFEKGTLEAWARRTLMGSNDPLNALAGYLAKLLNGDIKVPEYLPEETISTWFKIIPPAWMWSLYRRLRLFFRYPASWGIDPGFIKDLLPRDEIRARIHKWANVITTRNS